MSPTPSASRIDELLTRSPSTTNGGTSVTSKLPLAASARRQATSP
jgi:hypothetical protein